MRRKAVAVIGVFLVCGIVMATWRLATSLAQGTTDATGGIHFAEFLISNDYTYAYGIWAADLDHDGDLDLTSSDALPHNNLYWYENDGAGNFKRHLIQKEEPERLERHMVADINRDGFPDVVIVQNLRGDLEWFQNSGTPRDGKLWKRHFITQGKLPGAYDVAVADLDGDGDLDVAASSWRLGNKFTWYENDGSPEDDKEWKEHVIEDNLAETRTIRAADFNRDGKVDLLGTASAAGVVVWYENPGKPATQPWKKHIIDTAPRPIHGQPVDMDHDGDVDVVMALGFGGAPPEASQVVWYENAGRPGRGETWKKHILCDSFPSAFEAVAADLDSDGDMDVVATAWGSQGRVAWFENNGDPRGKWSMHLLKDNWSNANMVLIADLNSDRRPDIVACAERGANEIRWWRYEGRTKAVK